QAKEVHHRVGFWRGMRPFQLLVHSSQGKGSSDEYPESSTGATRELEATLE
ncbi:unnamed protein product, partial [Adineta steineri]